MIRLNNATDHALLVAAWVQTGASILAIVVGVLGVVLAVRGINIARATAREQRENRAFPSDLARYDQFATVLDSQLDGGLLLGILVPIAGLTSRSRAAPANLDFASILQAACVDYTRHVTGASVHVAAYMAARRRQIQRIADEREKGSSYEPLADAVTINRYLTELAAVALDWVYPERRPATIERISPIIREVFPDWDGSQPTENGVPA